MIRNSILLLCLALAGCAGTGDQPTPGAGRPGAAVIKPDTRLRGTIKTVNTQGQYVIVDFGLGTIPPLNTELNVYQNEAVVGVVQLTGPSRGAIVAGDLISGEAAVGDLAIVEKSEEEEDPPED